MPEFNNDEERIEYLKKNADRMDERYICDIIRRFQEEKKQIEALKVCADKMDGYYISIVIRRFQEDKNKIEALKAYADKMDERYICDIIRTLQEEQNKIEALKAYADKMDRYSISYAIQSFQEDKNKIEALKAYADKMNGENIYDIIKSFQEDQNKIETLKAYADKMDSEDISKVIHSFQEDKNKIEALKTYADKMDRYSISYAIQSFQEEKNKLEALKAYADKMDSEDISKVIHSFQEDKNKLEALKAYPSKIKGISNFIQSFQEEKNKIEALKVYADCADKTDKYYIPIVIKEVIQSFQEEKNKIEALKVCVGKINRELIFDVIQTFQKEKNKIETLKVCADKIGGYYISYVIKTFQEEKNKIEAIKTYADKMDGRDISEVIKTFQEDKNKIEAIKTYADKMDGRDISEVIKTFQEDKNKIEAIKTYVDKMNGKNIHYVIQSFQEEKSKIEALKAYADKMDRYNISDVIQSFQEERNKIEALRFCAGRMNGEDIYNIINTIECSAENYSLLHPELDEVIKKYPKAMGKLNLNDLKIFLFKKISNEYFWLNEEGEFQNQDYYQRAIGDTDKKIVEEWLKIGFIPQPNLFEKVPMDKVSEFKPKTWFKLAKEPVFNISNESKMALSELAYCFGVFDEQSVEIGGKSKPVDEVTAEERRSGRAIDFKKRVEQILNMVHQGKLTNHNLHMMFDGTNMEYNPAFYRFFVEHQDEIFDSKDIMRMIPKIQRELPKIMVKCRGNIPTIEQCQRYFKNIVYEGVKEGNQHLAEVCHMAGVTQKKFEAYQALYDRQKQRDKESTIPGLKGKNYEILELTSPETLVIGEGGFSRCCQQIGGAGEECMKHSATSSNGRLVVIRDDDGRFIAQSWMWRNGNVVCFDSIEANAIEKNTHAEQSEYIELIEKTYREIAKDMIKKSQRAVEQFKKDKLAEIEREVTSEEEKSKKREKLEKICDEAQIKRVTVGRGYWPISQKITERFADRVVSTDESRVCPQENVSYIADSNIQYIVAEIEDLREQDLRTGTDVQVRYRDSRKIEVEEGKEIQSDTIYKLKQIEAEAHKEKMQMMQHAYSVYDLANIYGCSPKNLRVVYGIDWYYIYANNEDTVHIYDLARGTSRFEDERSAGSLEMGKALDRIMLESMRDGKDVEAELREDTSYILLLEMKKNGLIEQVGPDETFEFDGDRSGRRSFDDAYDEDSYEYDRRVMSEEEQADILKRKEEIKKMGATQGNTTMHHMTFRPTEKYKRVLERRYNREGVEH